MAHRVGLSLVWPIYFTVLDGSATNKKRKRLINYLKNLNDIIIT
jgi:hypothetical protein